MTAVLSLDHALPFRDAKWRLVQALRPVAENRVRCRYHGIPLECGFQSPSSARAFEQLIPKSWLGDGEPELRLDWWEAESLWKEPGGAFDDDPNPWFERRGDTVLQRDFAARELSDRHSVLVGSGGTDAFFNAFRWYLPSLLLKSRRLVMHSGVVVDGRGRANFFLGPSGAGKSTVASLAGDRCVVGDDVNLLDTRDLMGETALLGQRHFDPDLLDRRFPLGHFYWLRKADRVDLRPVEEPALFRYLLHSCLLADGRESMRLVRCLASLAKRARGFELSFRKTSDFWGVIDG